MSVCQKTVNCCRCRSALSLGPTTVYTLLSPAVYIVCNWHAPEQCPPWEDSTVGSQLRRGRLPHGNIIAELSTPMTNQHHRYSACTTTALAIKPINSNNARNN